jgi:hypothetical protein
MPGGDTVVYKVPGSPTKYCSCWWFTLIRVRSCWVQLQSSYYNQCHADNHVNQHAGNDDDQETRESTERASDLAELVVPVIWQNCLSVDSLPVIWQNCLYVEERASDLAELPVPVI